MQGSSGARGNTSDSFIGPSGGNWNTIGNWSAGLPGSSSDVYIAAPDQNLPAYGQAIYSSNATTTVGSINIDTAVMNISSGATLTTTNETLGYTNNNSALLNYGSQTVTGSLILGETTGLAQYLDHGTSNITNVNIGWTGSGYLENFTANQTFGTMTLGAQASAASVGTFSMDGGTTHTSQLDVGYQTNSSGLVYMTGGTIDTTLVAGTNQLLRVGVLGTGTFTQMGGSVTTCSLWVDSNSGGSGTYTLNSSSATLHAKNTTGSSDLIVGLGSGSVGTFNLINGTVNTDAYVTIGSSGNGTWNQSGGIANITGNLNIAQNSGSNGTFTLSGGTANVSGGLYVGGSSSGSGGTGTLSIASPGTLNVTGPLVLCSGGTINIPAYPANPGGFNWSGGTLNLTGSSGLTIGTSGPISNLNLASGMTLTTSGPLAVTSSGTLNLSGGTLNVPTINQTAGSLSSIGNIALASSGGNATVYNMSGGRLSTSGLILGAGGSFIWTKGAVTINVPQGSPGTTVPDTGGLYAWGFNGDGELGNGTTNNSSVPVAVAGLLTGVTAIAAGGYHGIAIQNGAAYAWGFNGYGELGNGTTNNSPAPVAVAGLLSGVSAIAAGGLHSLAIQNGAVYAWGSNGNGELGNGTTNDSSVPVAVVYMSSGVSAIAAGDQYSVVIENGRPFAWGYNYDGELGNGSTNDSSVPVAVYGLSSGVTAIAAGGYHCLALQNGAVYAWGYNFNGQLGNGTTGNYDYPVAVTSLSASVTAIAAGGFHSLALQHGVVYAWGANAVGQLGNGTTNDSSVPVAVAGITGTVTAIAAGYSTSYALCTDGSIWDWGSNGYGELGLGANSRSSYDTPQHLLPPAGFLYTSIASSSASTSPLATVTPIGTNILATSLTINSTMSLQISGDPGRILIAAPLNISGGSLSEGTGGLLFISAVNLENGGQISTSGGIAVGANGYSETLTLGRVGNYDSGAQIVAGGEISLVNGSAQQPSILNVNEGTTAQTTVDLLVEGSTVNLAGGTIRAGSVNFSSGTVFNWSSGLLDITSSGSSFGETVVIPAGGTLSVEGSISDPVTVNTGGSFNLSGSTTGSVTVNSGGGFNLPAGASVAGSLTLVTSTTVTWHGATTGPLNVNAGAVANIGSDISSGIYQRSMGAINISANSGNLANGQINILPASNHSNRQLVITAGLSMAGATGAWQGLLDLSNNDMDVQGGNLATITNQIAQGFNGGHWNGAGGIISTSAANDSRHLTSLGVILNGLTYGYAPGSLGLFDGYDPAENDILIKYTYYGDTNLDGKVDGSDYSRIDAAYLADKTIPTAMTGWFNGDFNYDGVVDGSDYTLIDNAFNTQGAQLAASIASLDASATSQAIAGSAVPEPTTVGLLGVAAFGLLGRRRR